MTTLILPGYQNSGPNHWQTLWERNHPSFVRVQQRDWEHPLAVEWVETLERYVAQAGPQAVIVAHSLGCITVAIWAQTTKLTLKGALLVAPPDTGAESCPEAVAGFVPIPMRRLPFPSIVVASTNDHLASVDFARDCTTAWGSRFIDAGALGHINADSGIGEWPEGFALLSEF
jgi:predicted alpha/beta hydrolase family esterase